MNKPTDVIATLRSPDGSQEIDTSKYPVKYLPEHSFKPSNSENHMLKSVSVTVGHTKNLGNYQSLNVQVSCTEYTEDSLVSFNNQLEWCIARMDEAFDRIQNDRASQSITSPTVPQNKINPASPQSRSDDLDL